MSVVIACKFNNGVVMAADRQVTRWQDKIEDSVNKIKEVGNKNIIIGGVGYLRDLQNMFYISSKLFNDVKELNETELVSTINSKLTNLYRENQFISSTDILNKCNSEFIISDSYNINLLCGDLSVLSGFDYYAIGCGQDLVMGHLNIEFEKKNPNYMDVKDIVKILKNSIKVACKDSTGIDDNVDIIIAYKHSSDLVEDSTFEIIERCEYDVVNKEKPKSECSNKCKDCVHKMRFIYHKKNKTIQMISN